MVQSDLTTLLEEFRRLDQRIRWLHRQGLIAAYASLANAALSFVLLIIGEQRLKFFVLGVAVFSLGLVYTARTRTRAALRRSNEIGEELLRRVSPLEIGKVVLPYIRPLPRRWWHW